MADPKVVGYATRTAHGIVVSKTPLASDSEPLLSREAVREAIERAPFGRRWCGVCESYDHDCGCSPSINERTKRALLHELGVEP